MKKHKCTSKKRRKEKKRQAKRQVGMLPTPRPPAGDALVQTPPPEYVAPVAPVRERVPLLKKVFRGFWWVVVAGGVLLGYRSYVDPRLSIIPREALDPNAPFSVPFIVENDGYLFSNDMTYRCFLREVKGTGDRGVRNIFMQNKDGGRLGNVFPKGHTTAWCDYIFPKDFRILSADVDIAVEHRPSFYLQPVRQRFRFVTKEAADHKLIWFPQSAPPEKNTE